MTVSPNTSLKDDSQESTQPTQERSQSEQPHPLHRDAWGSLIPCVAGNPSVSRVDFVKPKLRYIIGRGSRKSEAQCDITFPKVKELSAYTFGLSRSSVVSLTQYLVASTLFQVVSTAPLNGTVTSLPQPRRS